MIANHTHTHTVFHKDKIPLRLHLKFLLKVVSEFLLNHSIHFPVMHSKPHVTPVDMILHSLDLHHTLVLCLDRTRIFHVSPHLFVAIAERS